MGHNAAYDMLLSAYNKREEELRVATHVNVELDKNVQELVKLVEEMRRAKALPSYYNYQRRKRSHHFKLSKLPS